MIFELPDEYVVLLLLLSFKSQLFHLLRTRPALLPFQSLVFDSESFTRPVCWEIEAIGDLD